VNLLAMLDMRQKLGLDVGYSDHTLGIEAPIAAVALGATVIEKHFTLDKSLPGPDHKASLSPQELAAMVSAIRNIDLALGDGIKRVSNSEMENKDVARKSIVASRFIRKGELLTDDNLTAKRPGTGLSPMLWPSVIGARAIDDFPPDSQIRL
ncbi:MAG: N-acetylneuraminate synthase family protein, partial [Lachnospiraceae bacterium]|nr:N-acetylneuraminate synthase family protein [Lachnospiraceae bacterium]